ncbi:MAG: GGDEF domain-containing protein [Chloroflexota bacterium]
MAIRDAAVAAAEDARSSCVVGLAVFMVDGDELRPLVSLSTPRLKSLRGDDDAPWRPGVASPPVQVLPARSLGVEQWWSEPGGGNVAVTPLRDGVGDVLGVALFNLRNGLSATERAHVAAVSSKLNGVASSVWVYQRARQRSEIHPLTGCLLKQPFTERLAALVRLNPPRMTVFFCDLDHLKKANDELGHHVGDQLIAAVGRGLRKAVRGGDDIVGALGGDEFAAAVVGDAEPGGFARRIEEASRMEIDGIPGAREIGCGCSIGWASLPDDRAALQAVMARESLDLPGAMVKLADERMYAVKQAHHATRQD